MGHRRGWSRIQRERRHGTRDEEHGAGQREPEVWLAATGDEGKAPPVAGSVGPGPYPMFHLLQAVEVAYYLHDRS